MGAAILDFSDGQNGGCIYNIYNSKSSCFAHELPVQNSALVATTMYADRRVYCLCVEAVHAMCVSVYRSS